MFQQAGQSQSGPNGLMRLITAWMCGRLLFSYLKTRVCHCSRVCMMGEHFSQFWQMFVEFVTGHCRVCSAYLLLLRLTSKSPLLKVIIYDNASGLLAMNNRYLWNFMTQHCRVGSAYLLLLMLTGKSPLLKETNPLHCCLQWKTETQWGWGAWTTGSGCSPCESTAAMGGRSWREAWTRMYTGTIGALLAPIGWGLVLVHAINDPP